MKVWVVTIFNKTEFRIVLVTTDRDKALVVVEKLHEENPYWKTQNVVGMSSHEIET